MISIDKGHTDNLNSFPLGDTLEGDLKHNNVTFQSLRIRKNHLSLIISSRVFVVHYLEMRKMTMRNMSWAALLIQMLICNGDCGEKRQDMQSVNLIRQNLHI